MSATTRLKGTMGRRGHSRKAGREPLSLSSLLERFGLLLLLVLVVVYFSLSSATSDTFPTAENFDIIVGNQSVLAIAALATIIPLVCGQFDLSVGAVLGASSVLTAALLADVHVPLVLAITCGIAAGAFIGLVNGLLVAKLGINSLIATLAIATVLAGVSQAYHDGTPTVTGIPASLTTFGSGQTLGLPTTLFLLLAIALLVSYTLEQTPFGRKLRSVGSSVESARLVGLPVDRLVLTSFVLSGALAGAAGVLQLARSGSGDPQVGPNFTLPAIAAAFLGATVIRPGRFNVPGTLVAIFFLAALVSGLTLSGTAGWVQDVVNGAGLIAGLAISTLVARHRLRASGA
jgi:ribose transport system permease protein